MIRLVLIFKLVSVCGICFSQSCFLDISSHQESVKLEKLLSENGKSFNGLSFKNDSRQDFVKRTQQLREEYFDKIGDALTKKDSLEVVANIEKLSSKLYHNQKKDTKTFRKLSKRYKITCYVIVGSNVNDSEIFIEPCYALEIERERPLAFIISTHYRLLKQNSKEIYRVIIQ